jgi:predicted TIM-barrel enzyme
MLAMLSAIAAEGAGNDEGADARMNNAIAKFIGIEFITKAILMDQGFNEPTAGKMANALVNTDASGAD